MAEIQDNDLLLVNRGGTSYKITGADVKESLDPTKPPSINTVTLSEDDTSGARFTNQGFTTNVSLGDQGIPGAALGLKATLQAKVIDKLKTSAIVDVQEVGAWEEVTLNFSSTAPVRCEGICYSKDLNRAVLVGRDASNTSLIYRSDDGVNWTRVTFNFTDGSTSEWQYAARSDEDGKFVVGRGSYHFYSSDGINWTQGNSNFVGKSAYYSQGHWNFFTEQSGGNTFHSTDDFTNYKSFPQSVLYWSGGMLKDAQLINRRTVIIKGSSAANSGFDTGVVSWHTDVPWTRNTTSDTGIDQGWDNWYQLSDGKSGEFTNKSAVSFGAYSVTSGKGLVVLLDYQSDRSMATDNGYSWQYFKDPIQTTVNDQATSLYNFRLSGYGNNRFVAMDLSGTGRATFVSFDGLRWYAGIDTWHPDPSDFNNNNAVIDYTGGDHLYGFSTHHLFLAITTNSTKTLRMFRSPTAGMPETEITFSDSTGLQLLYEGDEVSNSGYSASGTVTSVEPELNKIYLENTTGVFIADGSSTLVGGATPYESSSITNVTVRSGAMQWTQTTGASGNARNYSFQGTQQCLMLNKPGALAVRDTYPTPDSNGQALNPWSKVDNSYPGTQQWSYAEEIDGVWYIWGSRAYNDCKILKCNDGSIGSDLSNWTVHGSHLSRETLDLDRNGDTWIMIGVNYQSSNDYYTVHRSTNGGVNWSVFAVQDFIKSNGNPATGDRYYFESVAYGNGVWVITGKGEAFRSTDDGATWTAIDNRTTTAFNKVQGKRSVVFDGNQFVAIVEENNTLSIVTSTDGLDWKGVEAFNRFGLKPYVFTPAYTNPYPPRFTYYHGVYTLSMVGVDTSVPYNCQVWQSTDLNVWTPAARDRAKRYDCITWHHSYGPAGLIVATRDGDQVAHQGYPIPTVLLEFSDSTNLDKFDQGAYVKIDGKESYGYVNKIGITGNRIELMQCSFHNDNFAEPGDVLISGPSEAILSAQKYLKFGTDLRVSSISDQDPGFIPFSGTQPTIEFGPILPNGEAPDETLKDGTTIQTTVEADNLMYPAVSKNSNVVTPTGTTRGIGGFDSNDPADVTAFNELKDSLDDFDAEAQQMRTSAVQALSAANFTDDEIEAFGFEVD